VGTRSQVRPRSGDDVYGDGDGCGNTDRANRDETVDDHGESGAFDHDRDVGGGTVGTSYSQTLAAAGGITPYAWAVTSGSLPAGLTLNASTARSQQADGAASGQINFTVTVTDSENPAKTANANLSITISAPTLTITTGSLATGVINQSYNASLSATAASRPIRGPSALAVCRPD